MYVCECTCVYVCAGYGANVILLKRNYIVHPFTATGRNRGPMLNSHRNIPERGEIQLPESERIFQKFQLEPEN